MVGREWPLRTAADAFFWTGISLPCLCWMDATEQEASVKPVLSHIHTTPSLHACIKPSLEQNSTTLFIPRAANSSSISQPGPKGLRWVVNFKAGLSGDMSSVGHGHPFGQVPSLHAVKSRCGVKTSFWGGHD